MSGSRRRLDPGREAAPAGREQPPQEWHHSPPGRADEAGRWRRPPPQRGRQQANPDAPAGSGPVPGGWGNAAAGHAGAPADWEVAPDTWYRDAAPPDAPAGRRPRSWHSPPASTGREPDSWDVPLGGPVGEPADWNVTPGGWGRRPGGGGGPPADWEAAPDRWYRDARPRGRPPAQQGGWAQRPDTAPPPPEPASWPEPDRGAAVARREPAALARRRSDQADLDDAAWISGLATPEGGPAGWERLPARRQGKAPPKRPGAPPKRGAKRKAQRHPWGMIIVLTLGLTVATYGLVRFGYGGPIQVEYTTAAGAAPPVNPHYQLAGNHYIGLATKLGVKSRLAAFEKVLGRPPGIVEFYTGFGTSEFPFPSGPAMYLAKQNILTLIQINPYDVSLSDVAAGKYDAYLRSYADSVKEFHSQVAISFAHEMNGWWYPWGLLKYSSKAVIEAKATAFIGAWRRMYNIFQQEGATNVKWVWTVSRDANWPGQPTPETWWPGSKYVTWVGLDGYFRKPGQTFSFVFDRQLARIRQFTNKPVVIGETAAGYIPDRPTQIANLFQGVQRTKSLIGFIWFDLDAKEQWNIDDKPHAIAAFQHQIALYPPAEPGKKATPRKTAASR